MINADSFAAGVGVRANNVAFQPGTNVVPRKILVIATVDPAKEDSLQLNTPIRLLSPEEVGSKMGFGFMAHRLAQKAFKGAQGLPVHILPLAETQGAGNAVGGVEITALDAGAGTLYFYVSNDLVAVPVAKGDTGALIAAKLNLAINSNQNLPIDSAVDGKETNVLEFESKSAGPFGNKISLAVNLYPGQALPAGVTVEVTAMDGGSGVPSLETALANLGTDDDANQEFFTDVVHGFLEDSTALNELAEYVGLGNTAIGTYGKMAHRPFRVLTGNVEPGSVGLTNLFALANGRREDRGNGVLAVPGSKSHPSEIAALAIAKMAVISHLTPAQGYVDTVLEGIHPGVVTDRWTKTYANRDQAVRGGIGVTKVSNDVVYLQNVMTFYRPETVAEENNGYRSMRSIAILQNILANIAQNFSGSRWSGFYVVADTAQVTNSAAKEKARDREGVLNDLVALTENFEGFGWIFTAEFTIGQLASNKQNVVIRTNGTGFDVNYPVLLSGEGGIIDTTVQFDTSLAVAL